MEDPYDVHNACFIVDFQYDTPVAHPQTPFVTPPMQLNDVSLAALGKTLQGNDDPFAHPSAQVIKVRYCAI